MVGMKFCGMFLNCFLVFFCVYKAHRITRIIPEARTTSLLQLTNFSKNFHQFFTTPLKINRAECYSAERYSTFPQAFVHHVGRGFKLSRNFFSASVIYPSEPGQRFSPKMHGVKGHLSLWIGQWHLQNLLLCLQASWSLLIFVLIVETHSGHCNFLRPSFLKWSIILVSNFFHPNDIRQCWHWYVSTSSGL